ncbi:peptide N-acetyl-beta-D-glucosaminyl asparaginase amidase A-domain-containing protein [Boeremia exigua]|uniref:peptide N-acetyl-beta-D-glucosaminyl asparaginase amidase A-domain-containing protein n=1 Tax=Boeremia exigua TaxID=749465 RepID=UPI001E8E2231|nr:peptide N-acetyl-beta-D-glucosaminyl asparaginase amidase A-domain-containing protein [Boeremia exigua]KAH6611816.1 peptide N-acetyl-beta-D-glucosaminyl asparaginase amidase A-domain-containing protein [Boeremia exigua]
MMLSLLATAAFLAQAALLSQAVSAHGPRPRKLADVSRAAPSSAGPLEVIQLYKPVTIPESTGCNVEQTLMEHTFASSYGVPYVGKYTPPSCDFNSVVIEWTVTVAGRQFDRLAEMYLGDIEVWRTSTAEPTASGIVFRYQKDLSMYLSLWKTPQDVIFSLNNVYDSTYTGAFNTTLVATFSQVSTASAHADLILPISPQLGSSGAPSIFTLPGDDATSKHIIPLNVTHASVSIAATGQSSEEFWYTNALQSDIHTFESTVGTLIGYGPFREVQLFIDGLLAGVAWPFPIIFTGGVAPGFWKPIVGIDAYDLRDYEVDITPFLPYLLDGKPHSFTIKVAGVADNGGNGAATISEDSINSYWLVSGKLFLFSGAESYNGTHVAPRISAAPTIQTSTSLTSSNGTNQTLSYSVTAKRVHTVTSSFGTWTQNLAYSNTGYLGSNGLFQYNSQKTSGTSAAVLKSAPAFSNTLSYTYPIVVNTTYTFSGSNLTIDASLDRALEISSSGRPDLSTYTLVSGPMQLDTRQIGKALYSNKPNNSYSFGDMDQTFSERSYSTRYSRHVKSQNLTVVYDEPN